MTSDKISNWTERMKKLLEDERTLTGISKSIIKRCPYKDNYFCDGTPNKTLLNAPKEPQKPCPMFINGKCKRQLHKEDNKKEAYIKIWGGCK